MGRRGPLLLGIALLLLAAAMPGAGSSRPSSAAARDRVIGVRGMVLEISADGPWVAIRSRQQKPKCENVAAWAPGTGRIVRFDDGPCGNHDVRGDALLLAGERAAWVDIDDTTETPEDPEADCHVRTATLGAPRAVEVPLCDRPTFEETQNSGAEDLAVYFAGDGPLLAVRSFVSCYEATPNQTCFQPTSSERTERLIGAKVKPLPVPQDPALLAVDGDRLLLRGSKQLEVVRADATPVLRVPFRARPLATMQAGTVVAAAGGRLRVYEGKPQPSRTWPFPLHVNDAEPFDLHGGVILYKRRKLLRALRLSDGRDIVLRGPFADLRDVELEAAGAFYAFNKAGLKAKPGRVAFIPFARIKAALGS